MPAKHTTKVTKTINHKAVQGRVRHKDTKDLKTGPVDGRPAWRADWRGRDPEQQAILRNGRLVVLGRVYARPLRGHRPAVTFVSLCEIVF
jgi:hypothetical protein